MLYLIHKHKTTKLPIPKNETWFVKKNDIKVKVSVEDKIISKIDQTSHEVITLTVKEKGMETKKIVIQDAVKKYTFPQEFLELIKENGKLKFLGWYPDFNFKPLRIRKDGAPRIITVLRRE